MGSLREKEKLPHQCVWCVLKLYSMKLCCFSFHTAALLKTISAGPLGGVRGIGELRGEGYRGIEG